MTEAKKKTIESFLRWSRNIIGGAVLAALLWLMVDIRDTIRYIQPEIDRHQNDKIDRLQENCLEFAIDYDVYKKHSVKEMQNLSHRIDRTENDIYLLDSQMRIILENYN